MDNTIYPRPALAILSVILVFGIISCSRTPDAAISAPVATVGNSIDDSVITAEVKSALLADQDIRGLGISVETRKGLVQLRGFADSQARIDQAVSLARNVEGVKDIDNGINLRDARQSLGTKVDDSTLTVRVKTALLTDANISSADIKVASSEGVVQLSGFVNNQAQIDQAVRLAGAVEGASSVRNEMRIKH
jgi:hyperosmotically inducible protein